MKRGIKICWEIEMTERDKIFLQEKKLYKIYCSM